MDLMSASGGCSQKLPLITTRALSRFGRAHLLGGGQVVAHQLRVLLHRQHHAGAQQQVDLGGGRLPGAGAVGVEVADGRRFSL